MIEAGLGCGGNLGDPAQAIAAALTRLGATAGIRLARVSSLYCSAPWGRTDQPHFVNAVALLETSLSPRSLLARLRVEESNAGRVRGERWGPRTLDLDLLWYGDARCDEPDLVLPHPRLAERSFVLAPLAEIHPAWRHPVLGRTAGELLEALYRAGRFTPIEVTAPPPRIPCDVAASAEAAGADVPDTKEAAWRT